jgi:hypothetical protein
MYQIDPFLDGLAARMAGQQPTQPTLADLAAQAFARAQATQLELAEAEQARTSIPYDARQPALLEKRKQAGARVEQLKARLADETQAYNVANNNRASAEIQSRFRQEEADRTARRDLAEAEHAAIEQELYHAAVLPAYLQAGGTRAEFEAAKASMWKAELKRRAVAALEQGEKSMRADGRYSF